MEFIATCTCTWSHHILIVFPEFHLYYLASVVMIGMKTSCHTFRSLFWAFFLLIFVCELLDFLHSSEHRNRKIQINKRIQIDWAGIICLCCCFWFDEIELSHELSTNPADSFLVPNDSSVQSHKLIKLVFMKKKLLGAWIFWIAIVHILGKKLFAFFLAPINVEIGFIFHYDDSAAEHLKCFEIQNWNKW